MTPEGEHETQLARHYGALRDGPIDQLLAQCHACALRMTVGQLGARFVRDQCWWQPIDAAAQRACNQPATEIRVRLRQQRRKRSVVRTDGSMWRLAEELEQRLLALPQLGRRA